VAVGEESPR